MSLASTLHIIFGGASYRKTSGYGYRIHPITKKKTFHYGVDYGCSKVPLYAIEDGVVYKRGYQANGAGNYVYVKYPRLGVAVAYFHLTSISLGVGATVKKGTKVGVAGTTGASTGVHLHIGVRSLSSWQWQNPETWLTNYQAPSGGTSYGVGKTYTLQANMKVRTGAGTKYAQKKRSQLTKDGQKNALSGTYAVLKKGTKVTAKIVIASGSDIWLQIPSGYVCAKQGGTVYIK
jgi:murein DD-endopeptidase MepM/ murein hydrolase activator NlpD